MRRQYLNWMIFVFGVVGTAYGTHLLIYNFNKGKGLFVPALILLIFGAVALTLIGVLYLITYLGKKHKVEEKKAEPVKEEIKVEEKKEEFKPEIKKEDKLAPVRKEYPYNGQNRSRGYTNKSRYDSDYSSTCYVKEVGYGPILRVTGNQVVDMRNNTYYRIQDNYLMQDGYGPVFEIRDNQIKDAYGSYLYELNGSNINKVFGGFYASISGNYINLYDMSKRYEMSDSLSRKQLLVVAALLFGKY